MYARTIFRDALAASSIAASSIADSTCLAPYVYRLGRKVNVNARDCSYYGMLFVHVFPLKKAPPARCCKQHGQIKGGTCGVVSNLARTSKFIDRIL